MHGIGSVSKWSLTSRTRNAVVGQPARGFESHRFRFHQMPKDVDFKTFFGIFVIRLLSDFWKTLKLIVFDMGYTSL